MSEDVSCLLLFRSKHVDYRDRKQYVQFQTFHSFGIHILKHIKLNTTAIGSKIISVHQAYPGNDMDLHCKLHLRSVRSKTKQKALSFAALVDAPDFIGEQQSFKLF